MGLAGVHRAGLPAGLLLGLAACGSQVPVSQTPAPADRMGAYQAIRPVVANYIPAAQVDVVTSCVIQTAPAADISNFAQTGGATGEQQTLRILDLIKAPRANDCIAKQLL